MDRFKPPTAKEQNDYPLCDDCQDADAMYVGNDTFLCEKCEELRSRYSDCCEAKIENGICMKCKEHCE